MDRRSGTDDDGDFDAFVASITASDSADDPRHESPWGTVEHESLRYELTNGTNDWSIDFADASRNVS